MDKINHFINNRVLFNRMLLCAAFVLLCFVAACGQGGSNGTDGATPVSFTLQFPGSRGSSKVVHRSVTSDSNKIASLSLSVINSIGTEVAAASLSVTTGQPVTILLDVPPGSGLIFKVTVSDSNGTALYRGESSPTTVIAGVETSVTIALLTLNPLAGSWFLGPVGTTDSVVVTFLDDRHYMIAEDGVLDEIGQRGMESGTYTWDISTGLFTVNVVTDTNGQWGLSHPLGTMTIVVSGDTLTFNETDGETEQLTKIQSASNPLIGSWFFGVVGATNSAVLTFIDDSNYMIALEAVGDQSAGIERGTYNWDVSTGIFTVSIVTRTTDQAGLAEESGTTTVSISGNLLKITDSAGSAFLRSVPLQETITLRFEATTVPGVYDTVWDDTPDLTHVFTFNADKTGVVDWADDPIDEGFSWSVDAQGRLIVDLAGVAPGTLPDRYTLVSGTMNAGTIAAEVDDNEDGVYEAFPTVNFTKQD